MPDANEQAELSIVANDSTRTARGIGQLLRLRHPAPEWAFFEELRGGTGYAGYGHATTDQRLDAFALNTWPSRMVAIAYEIKVSRGDFLHEMEHPEKRVFAERVANECFFAVPSKLVRVDEVPERWGLIEVTTSGCRVRKVACHRAIDPWPMTFVASILRRSAQTEKPVSKSVWLHEGQKIDEAKLLVIAEEVHERTIAAVRQEAERNADKRVRETAEYQDMERLVGEVSRECGLRLYGGCLVDQFRAWAAKNRETLSRNPHVSTESRSKLDRAYQLLGEVLR